MKQKVFENSLQISFLSAVYLHKYLESSWKDDKNNARQYLIKAVEQSPAILENLENLLINWSYQRPAEEKINFAKKALSNFPKKLYPGTLSKNRVVGSLYFAEAYTDYKKNKGNSCIRKIVTGLLVYPSSAANYGVWVTFVKALLRIKYKIPKNTFSENILNTENAPASLIQKIEIKTKGKINEIELVSDDITEEICYRVLIGQNEFFLRTFQKDNDLLQTRLRLIKQLFFHQIPIPKLIIYGQVDNNEEFEFDWLLEEKIQGERFFPEKLDRNQIRGIFKDAAIIFKKLHTIDTKKFGKINFKDDKNKLDSFDSWLLEQREIILAGFISGAISEDYYSTIENAFGYLRKNYSGPPILCHGDLQPENVLVENEKVRGIIDWEAATGNDPAYDIAIFFSAFHKWFPSDQDEIILHFLETYDHKIDHTFLSRVKAHQILISADLYCWTFKLKDNQGYEQYCRVIKKQIDEFLNQMDYF